ncbi:DUF1648 domain-containing protein [Clostridium gasigenes]|uniref:DUF1648 domain-containing protein n=1 Tax=Clostridium gasigenes TaxID=94869 RepID=UPI001C0D717B|nr:DUF1648 domain-containing protein [Clostridium gasigenes]MBU3136371.1 DUF1648 domain-containing protein [Clostridium gasigenes]
MNKKLNISKIFIFSLTIIVNVIFYNYLSNPMVINYSFTGQPNYAVNKLLGLSIVPIIMIVIYVLENTKIPKRGSIYTIFSVYIVMFLLNLFLLIANL